MTDCGTQPLPTRPDPALDARYVQRGREGNSYPFEDGIIKRVKRGEDPIAAHERVRYDMMTRTAGKKGAKKE